MNVIKHTKTQRRMLQELLVQRGGCVMQSDWTNGIGSYTTKRAVPVYSEDLSLDDACQLGGAAGKAARKLRRAHPRCERVIIVTDIRAARACLRAVENAADWARSCIRAEYEKLLSASDRQALVDEVNDTFGVETDRDRAASLADRLYGMGRIGLEKGWFWVDTQHLDEVREWGQR